MKDPEQVAFWPRAERLARSIIGPDQEAALADVALAVAAGGATGRAARLVDSITDAHERAAVARAVAATDGAAAERMAAEAEGIAASITDPFGGRRC